MTNVVVCDRVHDSWRGRVLVTDNAQSLLKIFIYVLLTWVLLGGRVVSDCILVHR